MPRLEVISALARSLLAGEPGVHEVHRRAARTLGRVWRWLRPLARRYSEKFAGHTRPRHRDVIRFLRLDAGFRQAWKKYSNEISIAEWIAEPQRMQPVEAAAHWGVPAIETVDDLADWLCLSPDELEWFADLKGLLYKARDPKLRHYHYRLLAKRSGGIRVTEIPKPWLKLIQRRILSGILDRVPVHSAVHGFVRRRSIASFALPHAGKRTVLRMDLQDFFPAFPRARVEALVRTLGYPEPVAARLAGICTNAVPPDAWPGRPLELDSMAWYEMKTLYQRPHLPQGAPTSPALANLMTYRLDCRLNGLAKSAGATYTRYADDIAFSGDDVFQHVRRFAHHVAAIALEEGFSVNHHKTRIMGQGVRQQLTGIVVNQAIAPRRNDLERLEAILTNCVRKGSESQNREKIPNFRAHLEGRIGFVEMIHRGKGQKLRAIFDRIQWE